MKNGHLLKTKISQNQTKQCDEPPQTKVTADSTIGTESQRSEHIVRTPDLS